MDVADLPAGIPSRDALNLAQALTQLSEICWRCYTHPASAADSHGPNSEGECRQEERDAFTSVLTALTSPNLPADGYMIQSSIRVEEAAHQVGRALHTLNAAELTTRVTLDVGAELAAIEQAELGNLSERSRQAVALTREDASPLQVAQASNLLHDNPSAPKHSSPRSTPPRPPSPPHTGSTRQPPSPPSTPGSPPPRSCSKPTTSRHSPTRHPPSSWS
ncbi:hypothetical protein [Nonomuraea cypriaca]|uniref:hypothetical protein n=1 Tax=Nonomuraea cypriaca TaxID=1187855 RepID=UPI001A9C2D4C|nr:hypothetical protein [Nonomuraea cypriaca]